MQQRERLLELTARQARRDRRAVACRYVETLRGCSAARSRGTAAGDERFGYPRPAGARPGPDERLRYADSAPSSGIACVAPAVG